jgi:inner membrane protein
MSTFGHLAVGAAVGRLVGPSDRRKLRWWMVWLAVVGIAADFDFIGVWWFGVGPGATWNHRGATHSMVVAALGGLASVVVARWHGLDRRLAALVGTFVAATHPILDGFSRHAAGLPLWWPVSADFWQSRVRFLPGVVMTSDYLQPAGILWLAIELLGSVGLVWAASRLKRSGRDQEKPPAGRSPPVALTSGGPVSSRPK